MKIIQICGTNGTGKTTLVKNLLLSGGFLKMQSVIDGKSREWWYDGKTIVIGKYNSNNCCGVDAGNYTGEELLSTIKAVIQQEQPLTVVFEDVRYGSVFSFKQKLKSVADSLSYDYYLLNLIADLDVSCNRVLDRSGNSKANYDAMRQKARGVIYSTRKAEKIGAKALFCDTGKADKQTVLNLLRGVINA